MSRDEDSFNPEVLVQLLEMHVMIQKLSVNLPLRVTSGAVPHLTHIDISRNQGSLFFEGGKKHCESGEERSQAVKSMTRIWRKPSALRTVDTVSPYT